MNPMTESQKKIFNRLLDEVEPLTGYLYALDHEDLFEARFREIEKIENKIRLSCGDDSKESEFRKAIMAYRKAIFLLDAIAKTTNCPPRS
jgi:hypothetical protein